MNSFRAAAGWHERSLWRLPLLMLGLVFGGGRRVGATWLRAAGLSLDDRGIARWHLNLWRNTFVELWAWKKSAKERTHCADP